jgi:hypothetical protein
MTLHAKVARRKTTAISDAMLAILHLFLENLFLRHQLNIVLKGAPHRPRLRGNDRALLV